MTSNKLISLLDYDPDTGVFIWRPRTVSHFSTFGDWKRFHTKHSGKEAGCIVKIQGRSKDGIRSKHGVRIIRTAGKNHLAHRLAFIYMRKEIPSNHIIIHLNGVTTDNRFVNLKASTRSSNQGFRRQFFTKGYYKTQTGQWRSQITVNNKCINVGIFNTEQDAYDAYEEAVKTYGTDTREADTQ